MYPVGYSLRSVIHGLYNMLEPRANISSGIDSSVDESELGHVSSLLAVVASWWSSSGNRV